ncbi:hypothetical protein CTI14_27255 [Methylobacterium radiotolerans]|nr:hypothetical protein CTI14_27255 [Methylobacterium radiotolerans]
MTMLSVAASTTYGTSSGAAAAGLIGALFGAVIGLAVVGLLYMGIFTKAGRPAWEAYVPFYNFYVLITQIVGASGLVVLGHHRLERDSGPELHHVESRPSCSASSS